MIGQFHSLLWAMFVDGNTQGKVVVFHVNVTSGGNELILSHAQGGYWSTGVYFDTDNYNEASEICGKLNLATFSKENLTIFGYHFDTEKEAYGIVLESMRKPEPQL